MNQADPEKEAIEERRPVARRADSDSEHAHDIEFVSAYWEGPIPPPNMMRQYDDVVPGAAERIIRVWEGQSNHRAQIEKTVVIGGAKRAYLGIACAFVLSLLMIAIGAYAVIWGNPWVGAAVLGTQTVGLASAFIYGTGSRRRERERERKAADANPSRD